MSEIETLEDRAIVREPDALKIFGGRPTAMRDAIMRGEFPAPIRLSETGRSRGWIRSELIAWQEERKAKRDVELIAKREAAEKARARKIERDNKRYEKKKKGAA